MTRSRSGFTLIELLVVMGIMILIGAVIVSSSFGMSRASGYQAAENVVYNTLQLAHERACTAGKRVVVAFVGNQNPYEDDSLTAIAAVGTVSEEVVGNYIQDRCANLAKYTENGKQNTGESSDTVWNMATGAKVEGFDIEITTPAGRPFPDGSTGAYAYGVTQLRARKGSFSGWKKGDPYGFQIIPVQVLPKGFKIGMGSVGASPSDTLIVFEPSGGSFKASAAGMRDQGGVAELYIYEEISKNDPSRAIRIKVDNGVISRVVQ